MNGGGSPQPQIIQAGLMDGKDKTAPQSQDLTVPTPPPFDMNALGQLLTPPTPVVPPVDPNVAIIDARAQAAAIASLQGQAQMDTAQLLARYGARLALGNQMTGTI